MNESWRAWARKVLMYGVCGGSGVALDLALYTLLVANGVWYQLANLCGYASGTVLSFVLNRAFTFRTLDAPLARFAMFSAVAAFGYCVSTILLWVGVERLGLDKTLAKGISIVIVVVMQFGLNALITFRQRLQQGGA